MIQKHLHKSLFFRTLVFLAGYHKQRWVRPGLRKSKRMAQRVTLKLEYLFHCSPKLLFKQISTPSGLETWFADRVNVHGGDFEFVWNQSSNRADLLENKNNSHVRFRWKDSPTGEFFEMRIKVDELTSDVSILITDFCESGEEDENRMLWNQSVNTLRSRIGA